uniref:Wax synthase domain-containing protein n=1 Tax=Pseudo-nitzschia australis TaxID=44445 RepID=A0A7S4AI18_9STRA
MTTNNNPSGSSAFYFLSETDDRKPLFTFSIPSGIVSGIMVEGTGKTEASRIEFGFLMMSHFYWIELLACVIATMSMGAVVGLVLYHTVIKPKQEGTSQAYMIGWGIVLPFWFFFSFLSVAMIDIRNFLFKFIMGCVTVVCFFRTIECVHGFTPEYAKGSASEYCFYYATIPILARVKKQETKIPQNITEGDKGDATKSDNGNITNTRNIGDPIPCSSAKAMKHFVKFQLLLLATGLSQSILSPHRHFAIFGTGNSNEEIVSLYAKEPYFTWQLYANSAIQALFLQLVLTTYLQALIFLFTLLTGYEAEPVMDNPLMTCQSPSEFWGKRWNLLVHTVLKNGVYKPVRKACTSKTAAVIMTFLSSGIFHEWLLLMLFTNSNGGGDPDNNSNENTNYQPNYGGTTVFFLWQALLIAFEFTLVGSKLFQRISRTVPRPLKTAFVVGTGIPLAHFFLEPYVRSNFFRHGAHGLPMIVRIPNQ